MLPPPRHTESRALPDGDAAIRATDSDAALARLSAVQKQYLADPFIRHLVPRAHLQPPRPPLINVGTYVRAEGIDKLVDQWLSLAEQEGTACQIVSLGAGSDTRFWRISVRDSCPGIGFFLKNLGLTEFASRQSGPRKASLKAYVELDFPEVTMKKAMAIRKSKDLSAVLGSPDDVRLGTCDRRESELEPDEPSASGGMALHAPTYHLIPADLRKPPSEILPPLAGLLSPSHPTLLLFECVLVYMSSAASAAVIQWFVDYFSMPSSSDGGCGVLGGIVYEMFGLEDSFGRVMKANLQARNVSLPGAEPYQTAQSLPTRFLQHGFTMSNALTLRDIRRAYVDPAEQKRCVEGPLGPASHSLMVQNLASRDARRDRRTGAGPRALRNYLGRQASSGVGRVAGEMGGLGPETRAYNVKSPSGSQMSKCINIISCVFV